MKGVFRTSSMPAAAHAVACGARMPQVEQTADPQRCQLCFEDPDGAVQRSISEYFGGGAVSSRDFYRALQDVRFAINRSKGGAR